MRSLLYLALLSASFALVRSDYQAPYRCIGIDDKDSTLKWYGPSDLQITTNDYTRIQAKLTNKYVHHDYSFTATLQIQPSAENLQNQNTTYIECLSTNGSPRQFKMNLLGADRNVLKSYWIESNQACKVSGQDNQLDGLFLQDVKFFTIQERKF
jgi:hypothetical protein